MSDDPQELTDAQIDRIDYVHNTIYEMLCDLAGQEIEWDMHFVEQITDLAEQLICKEQKLMTDMEFCPYVLHKENQ